MFPPSERNTYKVYSLLLLYVILYVSLLLYVFGHNKELLECRRWYWMATATAMDGMLGSTVTNNSGLVVGWLQR